MKLDEQVSGYRFWGWLALITVLGAALRLYELGSPSFWLDEIYMIRACHNASLDEMLITKAFGYIPTALAYSLMGIDLKLLSLGNVAGWMEAGVSEATARAPAAVMGILTIPLVGIALRKMVSDPVALLTACLLALSTWHIQYSQVARFYSQQFLFYSVAFIMFYTATQDRSQIRTILALGLAAAAFLSQPTALVIAVVLAGDWAISRIRGEPVALGHWTWSMIVVATIGAASLFLYEFLFRSGVADTFIGEGDHSPVTMIAGTAFMLGVPVVIISGLTGLWLLYTERRLGIYLMLGAVGPVIAFAGIGLVARTGLRYVLVVIVAWMVLAAIGVHRIYQIVRPQHGVVIASLPACALFGSMLYSNFIYYEYGNGYRPAWRSAFTLIEASRKPSDIVYMQHPWIGRYYLQCEEVQFMPRDEGEYDGRTGAWVVTEDRPLSGSTVPRFMRRDLQLIDVWSNQVPEPQSHIRVYYVPARDANQ